MYPDDGRRFPVAWFWTDDLARSLVDTGVPRERLATLLQRPAAIAATDESAALDTARRLAGLDDEGGITGAA